MYIIIIRLKIKDTHSYMTKNSETTPKKKERVREKIYKEFDSCVIDSVDDGRNSVRARARLIRRLGLAYRISLYVYETQLY